MEIYGYKRLKLFYILWGKLFMKNVGTWIVTLIALFMLSACQETSENVDGDTNVDDDKSPQETATDEQENEQENSSEEEQEASEEPENEEQEVDTSHSNETTSQENSLPDTLELDLQQNHANGS